jgi:hypothetical protein
MSKLRSSSQRGLLPFDKLRANGCWNVPLSSQPGRSALRPGENRKDDEQQHEQIDVDDITVPESQAPHEKAEAR